MNKRLKIALDVDDVLYSCVQYAIDLEKEKGNILNIEDYTCWGKQGNKNDIIFDYFKKPEFYKNQPLIEGAQKFVRKLISKGHEVIILTAVAPEFAGIRAERLKRDFPEVDENNIILSSRKDLVYTDVLIDDAAHNIVNSPAKYVICMRRPWNSNLTGLYSVFNYDQAISFIDRISQLNADIIQGPKVYCLVGPSGSGKTAIANEATKNPLFKIPLSSTTRKRREGESDKAYEFLSLEEFNKLESGNCFVETTIYAGNKYGTTYKRIQNILDSGCNAIMPIDICGANAIKQIFGDKVIICFVKRAKAEIFKSLLDRFEIQIQNGNSNEAKTDILNRILSYNSEKQNIELCDRVIVNNRPLNEIVAEL